MKATGQHEKKLMVFHTHDSHKQANLIFCGAEGLQHNSNKDLAILKKLLFPHAHAGGNRAPTWIAEIGHHEWN